MADSDKAGLRQMMPSLFNGIATAIAAAAGLIGVLHQTGYLGNHHPRLHAGIEARSRAQMRMPDETQLAAVDSPAAASLPVAGTPNTEAAPALHHARNLTGAWRDKGSNCHLIKQTGHELTVTTYFAEEHRSAVGNGTVKGRFVSMRINSANPESLQADLNLSDDGRELSGMVKGVKGAHAAMWKFIGPTCSEVASRPASTN